MATNHNRVLFLLAALTATSSCGCSRDRGWVWNRRSADRAYASQDRARPIDTPSRASIPAHGSSPHQGWTESEWDRIDRSGDESPYDDNYNPTPQNSSPQHHTPDAERPSTPPPAPPAMDKPISVKTATFLNRVFKPVKLLRFSSFRNSDTEAAAESEVEEPTPSDELEDPPFSGKTVSTTAERPAEPSSVSPLGGTTRLAQSAHTEMRMPIARYLDQVESPESIRLDNDAQSNMASMSRAGSGNAFEVAERAVMTTEQLLPNEQPGFEIFPPAHKTASTVERHRPSDSTFDRAVARDDNFDADTVFLTPISQERSSPSVFDLLRTSKNSTPALTSISGDRMTLTDHERSSIARDNRSSQRIVDWSQWRSADDAQLGFPTANDPFAREPR